MKPVSVLALCLAMSFSTTAMADAAAEPERRARHPTLI